MGTAHVAFARSPNAYAKVTSIALAPLGVKHIDMPLRPRQVWAATQEARG